MSRLLFATGVLAVVVGILVIVAATLWLLLSARGKVRAGGVALIGPFPIVFGTDRELVKLAFVLAVVLMILALFIMIFPFVITKF